MVLFILIIASISVVLSIITFKYSFDGDINYANICLSGFLFTMGLYGIAHHIINYSNNNIQKSCQYSHAVGLPLNIGGLTACVLLDCGCNVYNADLFPIICRSVGLTLIHQNAKQEKIKFSSSYDIIRKYNNTDNI